MENALSIPDNDIVTADALCRTAAPGPPVPSVPSVPSERSPDALQQRRDVVAQGELMACLAHELNNPLSVIVGQALLLQETAHDAATAERAVKIGRAADRSTRIIKSILAMARTDCIETSDVDINEVIHEALESVEHALRATDIQVGLYLMADLPPVAGDAGLLAQVVTNLLVNAQQAMAGIDGRRHLNIASTFRRNERQVLVRVVDSGPGIPEAIRPRIFEPFVTSKGVGAGTGIGLALSQRIVRSHGGTLTLERSSGEGAAFAIRLPVDRPPERVM